MKGSSDGGEGSTDDGLVEKSNEQSSRETGKGDNDLVFGKEVGLVLQLDLVLSSALRCRCSCSAVVMVDLDVAVVTAVRVAMKAVRTMV